MAALNHKAPSVVKRAGIIAAMGDAFSDTTVKWPETL
jgi:hypothetical protein